MRTRVVLVVLWLLRHPMTTVILALVASAVLAFGLTRALAGSPTPSAPAVDRTGDIGGVGGSVDGGGAGGAGTAPSTLPVPTQLAPQARVEAVHRALHALTRVCEKPMSSRDPRSVLAPLRVIEQFARAFPNGGFAIDDESASTLGLLVVVRYQMQDCAPWLVTRVERLLPARFRDPL